MNDPNIKLSAIDGLIFSSLYAYYFPKAQVLSLPELSPFTDQILQVSTGKADATLMLKYDASLFAEHNPNQIKLGYKKPVLITSNSYWLPHGDTKVKGMIDTVIDEMLYNGTIDNILAKHEGETRGAYWWRVAPEYEVPKMHGD